MEHLFCFYFYYYRNVEYQNEGNLGVPKGPAHIPFLAFQTLTK